MKKLLFLSILSLSFSAISSPILSFADGRYLGAGKARDDAGNSYDYQSYIEFSSNNSRADYAWTDGNTTLWLSFIFNDYGSFEVAQNDTIVGDGFCMSTQCHYHIVLNDKPIGEVLTFIDGHLHKLGKSIDDAGNPIYWEASLWNLSANEASQQRK